MRLEEELMALTQPGDATAWIGKRLQVNGEKRARSSQSFRGGYDIAVTSCREGWSEA
jgi:hypothetical protein